MILVDTSVWIDFVRAVPTWQALYLKDRLTKEPFLIGDLVLVELLQGCRTLREFNQARAIATKLEPIDIGGQRIVLQAAQNYRALRAAGITIRSTIDTLIATRCISNGLTLLHKDRDFEPFVSAFGLQVVTSAMH